MKVKNKGMIKMFFVNGVKDSHVFKTLVDKNVQNSVI